MEISLDQVKEILINRKRVTAEQVADDLGLVITQENRKATFRNLRSLIRKVVDSNGGKRDEVDNEGRQIYQL